MRAWILLLAALASVVALSHPVPVSVVTIEPEAEVRGVAALPGRLAVAYSNGTLIIYSLERFTLLARFRFPTIGLKAVGAVERALVAVFENGTIAAVDPETGSSLWTSAVTRDKVSKATVGGRWVVLITSYAYAVERTSIIIDRVLVYDIAQREVVMKIDRDSDARLVYAFYARVEGDLLLLVGIDTTCRICVPTDTYVLVYNLTSLRRVFAERVGECRAAVDGQALVVAKVKGGEGIYYDLRTRRSFVFPVEGYVLDVRAVNGTGYVLTRISDDRVALFRVQGDSTAKLNELPSGQLLFFLRGAPCVAGRDSLYVLGQQWSLKDQLWRPSYAVEYGEGAAIVYGRHTIVVVRALMRSPLVQLPENSTVTIVTEPHAKVYVKQLSITVEAGDNGLAVLRLLPGTYDVEVKKDGFLPNSTRFTVLPGANLTISITLAPSKPRRDIESGNVTIILLNLPPGKEALLTVVSNGTKLINKSVSGRKTVTLKPGEYLITVSSDGCTNTTSSLVLKPGESRELVINLNCRREDSARPEPRLEASRLIGMLKPLVAIQREVARPTVSNLPPVIKDIDNRVVRLSEGVKVLVFFYTKCTGCDLLVLDLRKLNVSVIMVSPSLYDNENTLREYRDRYNVSGWYWVVDEGAKLASLFNVSAFPTVMVLDNGALRFIGIGVAGEAEKMVEPLQWLASQLARPSLVAALAGSLLLALAARAGRERRQRREYYAVRAEPYLASRARREFKLRSSRESRPVKYGR